MQYFGSQNNVRTLPSEIGNLFNLRTFYYYDNPIKYINPQIIRENKYNLETHKQLVIENLFDKQYNMAIINEWFEYL